MGYEYGKTSKEKLSTCHIDLQKVLNLAISRSKVDFGISEGHRPIARQQELYSQGKSKIDGINKKGEHNYKPSKAGDIYIYHPILEVRRKLAYDRCSLSYVAGIIDSCAVELYEKGEITHLIRWGGNWDKDGVILQDQTFDDLPHFEIYNP